MATPTDQQQIRATLRRAGKTLGDMDAMLMAIETMVGMHGEQAVATVAKIAIPSLKHAAELPPIMGAAEAAAVLGIAATNINRLNPPLPVAAIISGRIPIYRESDVLVVKRRLDERRARRRANERERAERARVEAGRQALGSVTP